MWKINIIKQKDKSFCKKIKSIKNDIWENIKKDFEKQKTTKINYIEFWTIFFATVQVISFFISFMIMYSHWLNFKYFDYSVIIYYNYITILGFLVLLPYMLIRQIPTVQLHEKITFLLILYFTYVIIWILFWWFSFYLIWICFINIFFLTEPFLLHKCNFLIKFFISSLVMWFFIIFVYKYIDSSNIKVLINNNPQTDKVCIWNKTYENPEDKSLLAKTINNHYCYWIKYMNSSYIVTEDGYIFKNNDGIYFKNK